MKDSQSANKHGFKITVLNSMASPYQLYCSDSAEAESWIATLQSSFKYPNPPEMILTAFRSAIRNKYTLKEKIGAGEFSSIYKAVNFFALL